LTWGCSGARERHEQERAAAQRQFQEERERADEGWWRDYSEYLGTSAWSERRALVLRRANGMCESCLKARATQVHHLTYNHVRNEFLWELVAICRDCHERFHERDD
jgi:5-methylcytosine-specific restriction endonuclease McrA